MQHDKKEENIRKDRCNQKKKKLTKGCEVYNIKFVSLPQKKKKKKNAHHKKKKK